MSINWKIKGYGYNRSYKETSDDDYKGKIYYDPDEFIDITVMQKVMNRN